MKVVIPMAGFGTRLRPHTYSRPKPLVSVAGKPLLDHVIESLDGIEVDEWIFIVGYLGDQIREYVAENYDINAQFVEQNEMKGQSHAIYLAKDYLTKGEVIVLFSDTIFQADVDAINNAKHDGVIYTMEVEDPSAYGVVALNDENIITDFAEKSDDPPSNEAIIGLYYVKDAPHLIRAIEEQIADEDLTKGEYFIADALQRMIDDGAEFTTATVDFWLDCGKPHTLLETNRFLLSNGASNTQDDEYDNVTIIPPVYIHPDAKLENAVIGPNTSISRSCTIRDSIIRDSIVDTGASVTGAMLTESLIGRDAQVTGAFQKLNVGDKSSIHFG